MTTANRKPVSMDEFLDAAAETDTIRFTLKGEEFYIPPDVSWPDVLPNPLRVGYDRLGRAILGDDQWERYTALGGTGRALNAFYAHVTKQRQGVTPGESVASADS